METEVLPARSKCRGRGHEVWRELGEPGQKMAKPGQKMAKLELPEPCVKERGRELQKPRWGGE